MLKNLVTVNTSLKKVVEQVNSTLSELDRDNVVAGPTYSTFTDPKDGKLYYMVSLTIDEYSSNIPDDSDGYDG